MSRPVKNELAQHRPLRVGITGGIGSGKTSACEIFQELGIPVYFADDRAKALMVEDENLRRKITGLFGVNAYLPDGKLNRKLISDLVFQDKSKLEALNAIVHPAVFEDAERWQESHSDVPYTLKEAALLFESGSYQSLDKIILIYAPKELRINRVMQRDGVSRGAVEARMAQQMPDEEKMKRADFTILNAGHHSLAEQVVAVHKQLLALAKSGKPGARKRREKNDLPLEGHKRRGAFR